MMSSSLLDVASKATYSREKGKTKQRKTEERRKEEETRKVCIRNLAMILK